MIIARCWLEKLFKCVYGCAYFDRNIFNPEMIDILFDNDKTIPLKFQLQQANLYANNEIFENVLIFSLNHLSVSESLNIDFKDVNITGERTNILLNILIKGGNKFPKIRFEFFKLRKLYDLLIKYITSKDCSKIVPNICLGYTRPRNLKLGEIAKEVKKSNDLKSTSYLISNIYNPKTKFYLYFEEKKKVGDIHTLRIIKE
ncbi:unnamed protein product [Meloidogyne enterolobii]|uniref:Uncharacterized protein n=1 Tax=Meloidogyne enterolobii TaxID=390850 RepID=A0ACB0YS26_MELEN